ncbi:transporter substrate-binding domain-containing protein [Nakamurella sp. YIM 132087]|uniref:Transporter substrate-binding domain-containing protein n=1 Tax=Nakamurella alba TaxID=2665158 RepID=A0A7K1FSA5_9ACTN|nr:transporter substrate-binding domain-containing protein [Nakamurella alba]MTD16113.1 transporter substrate-binding domain-containing protein [Nakamurella alba]
MSRAVPRTIRRSLALGLGTLLLAGTAACGSTAAADPAAGSATATAAPGSTAVVVGAVSNGAATETSIDVPTVAGIRDQLPAAVKERGTLVIGLGALPAGFPPLAYVGDDQQTLTGAEPDLGRLVAAVLGLTPDIRNSTWENLFVGIDSGRTDIGFSNITDTEERKEKYDFASYRKDNLAFLTLASNAWEFGDDPANLAGQRVAVGQGTNQERILLAWQKKLQGEGKNFDVVYFPDLNSTLLALKAGNLDLYFGPNPASAYQVRLAESTATQYKLAGQYSGAGETLQGLIAATSKKGSGLNEPVAAAINYLIENGQYEKWLAAYNLAGEAVPSSEINPPGLPKSDT